MALTLLELRRIAFGKAGRLCDLGRVGFLPAASARVSISAEEVIAVLARLLGPVHGLIGLAQ